MTSSSQPLDTPLWTFSLAVYGRDGVADECLGLQERASLDVNILLFAAYIGAVEGIALERQDIAAASAAVADWQSEIVRSLRRARRALPASARADDPLREASAALRTQVKTAELDAEKIEQATIWQWSRGQLAERPRSDRALDHNLQVVLEFYQAGQMDAVLPRLHQAAAAYSP